ncbi:MAG TPA: bifunctional [glutamate--ammonia ligase]-adenylyl-L-tyrosine phosphorylase/[glutamate--ammonia-ligase] adenylyltransferase, partial [Myxococcales bacterium]|nr:bifunctional [glutamate--ammonia ligase]-adenylyl-L-tyrosine phosphorylase/[glutamate--ammonia-ligase] adenylyltransferase [Myxococcales bacterium]
MHETAKTQGAVWEDAAFAARLLSRALAETGHEPAVLEKLCLASADPDGALAGATRALAARKQHFGRPAAPAVLAPLVKVCAASRFLPQILAARPRLVDLLGSERFRKKAGSPRVVTARDAVALARKLRRQKQSQMLRIALRDLSGASVFAVTRELAKLASVSFESAVRFHYARLCEQHGPPEGRKPDGTGGFSVLGMGKLGGDELNFSSDTDVLYVYDKDGHTAQGLPHFSFYARLAEAVTAAVGSPSATPEGGFVFRVDLDLRPEGRAGPIVNAIRGLELYYEAQGAPWERFALLKARPIAGNLTVGEEALRRLTPFVFRKYFDLKAIDEMRQLKLRAQKAAERAGPGAGALEGVMDLKLGRGGIREIEFFVQALQLLHGGRDPNLRVRGTLRALERLLYAGLISSRDRDELGEAYVLLRRLEHRVQMVAERQTHAIPDDAQEQERLARRAGFATAAAMNKELARHRDRVEARFADLLRVAGEESASEDPQ